MYRKFLPAILIICSPALTFAQAPVLTASTSTPVVGQSYVSHSCDTTGVTPGSGGAGVSWDFSSSLISTSNDTINILKCSATPWCSDYPGATIASYDGSGTYYYYNTSDTTKYASLGFWGSTIWVELTAPGAYLFEYPFTYPNEFTNTIAGTLVVSGNNFPGTVNDTTICMGWGSLKLPGATYANVLMVNNSETYFDTAKVFDTSSLTYVFNNYSWFTPGYHNALLTITYINSALGSAKIVSYSELNTAAVPQVAAENGTLRLYPNPVSDELNIQFNTDNNEPVQITLLDITGRQVAIIANDKYSGAQQITYNTSSLAKGLYFIRMQSATQTITRKVEVL